MVIQINMQNVYLCPPVGVGGDLGRIPQHHLQTLAVGGQLEPQPASRHHLGVDFNRRGVHAQLVGTKLGQGSGTQAQLHGLEVGHGFGGHPQQPTHHALDIVQMDLIRAVRPHRALNPVGAQVQIAHRAVVGKIHRGQTGAGTAFDAGHGGRPHSWAASITNRTRC